jgi:cell division protein FtsQ
MKAPVSARTASVPPPSPSNRRLGKPAPAPDVLEPRAGDAGLSRASRGIAASRFVAVARAVLGGALVIGVSAGVAWAARRHIVESPRFLVTDIVVSGAKRRTAEDLQAEAGIARGQNVFTVDLDRARARLLADPWISEVSLARRLPGTILLQVTEREAAAIVAVSDTYLATREGEIFKRLELGDPSDLPVVTGVTSDQIVQDRTGIAPMIRRALDLVSDYEHAPLASRAPLEEIHLDHDGSVSLVVGKDGVRIALGVPPFRKKLQEAAQVIAELDRRGAKAETIMIDNEARPDRVVVRMRAAPTHPDKGDAAKPAEPVGLR